METGDNSQEVTPSPEPEEWRWRGLNTFVSLASSEITPVIYDDALNLLDSPQSAIIPTKAHGIIVDGCDKPDRIGRANR